MRGVASFALALLVVAPATVGAQGVPSYCQNLAAEAFEPLPPPPTAPTLKPRPDDEQGTAGALSQAAAAIAATQARGRAGLAAQSGYYKGKEEGDRERRERAYRDWAAANDVAIKNYELRRDAWNLRVREAAVDGAL